MSTLLVRLHTQEGWRESATGPARFQTHQWAEIPEPLSVSYMTGGLKRVRRMIESYCTYRFSPQGTRRVRGIWSRGQPLLRLRWLRKPLLQLGRLRQTGTVDVHRGFMEILGGDLVAREARAQRWPWPEDLPWVAPSAGEFDIEAERNRPSYLGIFELRVVRRPAGCSVHLFLRDFPAARGGLAGWLWNRPWQPLRAPMNLAYLQAEIQRTAADAEQTVGFETVPEPGVPQPLPPLVRPGATATTA